MNPCTSAGKNKITSLFLILTCCISTAIIYSSCNHKNKGYNSAEAEKNSMFETAQDSVAASSPNALKIVNKGMANETDSFTYYKYCILLGNLYRLMAKPDSMMIYANKTMIYTRRNSLSAKCNNELKAMSYEQYALYYYFFRMKADTCIYYHKLAYNYIMKSSNIQRAPDICANMADAYNQNDDIVQAAVWYRRALFLTDSLSMPHATNLSLYLGLAQIYMNLKDYKTSYHYYKLTNEYFNELKPNMQSYFLNNFGNYYYYTKDYKSAMKQFKRLQKILEHRYKNENDINLCRLNMADVYLNLGQLDSSEVYVNQSLKYFKTIELDAAIYYANTIRLAIALKRNNPTEARQIIQNENVIVPNEPNITEIRNRYLRQYYTKTGNFKAAYNSLLASVIQNDSLEHNKSHMRAADIMMRFQQDTLALHKQLNIDRQQKEVNNAYTWLATVIGTALIIILSFTLFYFYNRKQRLQSQTDLMKLRLTNVRNRISPHFIFNVLNHEINNNSTGCHDELMALTELIRSNLDISRHTYISLKAEIDFVKKFIKTQEFFSGDDFTYKIETPDEATMQQISVPSMFVQILVENTIKHGLRLKEGHKILTISISDSDDGTDILVRDNGTGFSLKYQNADSTHTGLNIIKQTIHIINESNKKKMTFYIHNIKSATGEIEGCEAAIYIPHGMKLIE